MDSSGKPDASDRAPLLLGFTAGHGNKHTANNATKIQSNKARFNVLFLKRFGRIALIAVPRLCSKSLLLLFLLLVARSAEEYNYYQVGVLPSQFYSALTDRDLSSFKDILWKMAVIIVSLCICKSGGEFLAGLVYVRWRRTVTQHLHSKYFSHKNYYLLNIIDHRIDNPDQRITQDVDRFCNQVSQTLPKIILQPFLIAYYTYRTFVALGWYGVLGIYGFFVVSTVINKFIMNPIVGYIFQQEKLEGNFRFHHVQVRANAESVAFYQGGKLEQEKANRNLKVLLRVQLGSVHWQLPLNFSVFMFDYVSTIISYSLIGIAVFTGKYDGLDPAGIASAISKNSFFTLYLLNGFSTVVDTAVTFAEVAGYTHRVGELLEVFKWLDKKHSEEEKRERLNESSCSVGGRDNSTHQREPSINSTGTRMMNSLPQCMDVAAVVKNLSVAPPNSTCPLVQGLDFEFRKGKNILVLGETGCGKSSILRVLRKLWVPLQGEAKLCSDGSHHFVMFLPQKTYLTSGSLADQITYPEKPKSNEDVIHGYRGTHLFEDRITEALQMAGLVHLRKRLGGDRVIVTENWYDIVSPGEMQKISFARLFFHKPPFAFLDEATSALSEESEHYFYMNLQQLGITVLSVGHRSTLKKYHHQILSIKGAAGEERSNWELYTNDLDSSNSACGKTH